MISKIPRLPSITIENKVEPLSCLNHYQQINRRHSGRRKHEDVFRSSKMDGQMSQESSLKKSKHDKLSFSTNRVTSPVHLSPLQSTQVQPVPVFSPEPPEGRPRRQCDRGVMRIRMNDETEFLPLDQWEQEYEYFMMIRKIPVFANFWKWKAFTVWRVNVRSKKTKASLRPALLNVREMCHRISDMSLCKVERNHTYSLEEFSGLQFNQLQEVAGKLTTFRDLVTEVVRTACRTALLEAGFTPDDYYFDSLDKKENELMTDGCVTSGLEYDYDILVEAPEKMTYTEQANKRAHCRRLACFIHLADYLIVNTMHTLAVNSVGNTQALPAKNIPSLLDEEEMMTAKKHVPLFLTEFILEPSQIIFQPDLSAFQENINEVIRQFQDTVLGVENLIPDSYFDAFTKPIINGKFEEKSCGDGPSLATMFEDDKHLQGLVAEIQEALLSAFNAANQYAMDVRFFSKSLECYHKQHKMSLGIPEQCNLGLLLIDAVKMKGLLIPSPIRCLNAINELLPVLARREVDRLITELQDGQFQLEFEPTSTEEYVKSLTFLDKIQDRIEPLESESNVVRHMYDLIEYYGVPTPPEDIAVFQTLDSSINNVRNAIDKALADRDCNLNKFCAHVDQDIAELNKEVKEVKEAAMDRAILEVESDKEKVKATLSKLLGKMNELTKKAFKFKSYQKNFKVEITKFEELEESRDEWAAYVETWIVAEFESLDSEVLNNTTMRYIKTVTMLEKGLPPNSVLPKLKADVENIREKLHTITDLRNNTLKPRHWEKIENILDYKFVPEDPLTLGKLMEMKAFQKAEEIEEISGQASAEYSLELILKKVEESWKTVEFIVLQHKDNKDTYILGGTDDIQQLWDDSNINIATLINIQRQLPSEDRMFRQVDKSYKDIMRKVQKVPLAMRAATQPGLLEAFQVNNSLLDAIHKCLEAYLESKRIVFSRFYFLSNDELLEILAQTRNAQAVQPHLRKCFDAIAKLEFGQISIPPSPEKMAELGDEAQSEIQFTNDILAMISPEGERIGLGKGLKARGNVEEWLGKVEESMFQNIRRLIKSAITDYNQRSREEWVVSHGHQVVLTVSQTMWCRDVTDILERNKNVLEGMKIFEDKCFKNLNKLAAIVRGDLELLSRSILCALITIDVHARDIITDLVEKQIVNVKSFEWQKQLRYYWDLEQDNCVVRMSNSKYTYGYEYLGASSRLVITPLTDRCYLCLMGALQLDLGGAPAGPAGTGKTETTKDLAKSLAKQCVVFNCSDGLDYKMMGRFFSGLAQSGAWCCFDEFNRIDIEVLSVIAQQLITIRNAKSAKVSRFMFEGREIRLTPSCAAFITMNPGYAGRTELPDNLKALFRPISMMVPDYRHRENT
ncbi:DNAH [Acanthosepion pharaonis]|uniref:DNAH n=1 Tax=Acanthosepion pharaonis TaxID=158019 RepID=A0A812EMG1_ACAPH|nr:DNAH [Sepia pharaonis]